MTEISVTDRFDLANPPKLRNKDYSAAAAEMHRAVSSQQIAMDRQLMRVAIALAERHVGGTWPNPSVGCVIAQKTQISTQFGAVVKNNPIIVGRGVTARGGRPHAETIALAEAGKRAEGATAYVTLEPCCHHGGTPPCADALAHSGIKRVVIGMIDPDPRIDGGGVARLRLLGIEVDYLALGDELAERCQAVVAGFVSRVRRGRPLVSVKFATSLDGRIATASGESRWITGQAARQRGHLLRARHDAIMIGAETALADNPSLECRLPGMADFSPIRIVLDGRLRLPLTSQLVQSAKQRATWIFTDQKFLADSAHRGKIDSYQELGVKIDGVSRDRDGNLDISAILSLLAARGLTSVLVEGGGKLINNFLRQNLYDRLYWFRAPFIIGGAGLAAVPDDVHKAGLALAHLPRLALIGEENLSIKGDSNDNNVGERLEIYQPLQ